MLSRPISDASNVDSDLWFAGYEAGLGDIIRPDCANMPETRMWLRCIIRALQDKNLPGQLTPTEKIDLINFIWSDTIEETNLVWIADHISTDTTKLIHMVRKAWDEGWVMYGSKVTSGAGEWRNYNTHKESYAPRKRINCKKGF